jgi:hypothetical protein
MSRGWELTKQSGRVLMSDKQLVLFPILSSIALLLVLATFAVPMFFAVDFAALMKEAEQAGAEGGAAGDGRVPMQPWYYVVLFAFYFVNFFVITFFNSALVACAINRFNGQDSSMKAGLAVATARLPQILMWSALAATVGVILKAIEERLGWLGQLVINLIGMVWTIATFFVVPVLVVEKVGPFDAVKRSVQILKKTWGETLVANLGIGVVGFLATLVALLPAVAGLVATAFLNSIVPMIIGIAITVLLLIAVSLIISTLKGILLAATYRFAATGEVPNGFDPALLQQAFKPKAKKA